MTQMLLPRLSTTFRADQHRKLGRSRLHPRHGVVDADLRPAGGHGRPQLLYTMRLRPVRDRLRTLRLRPSRMLIACACPAGDRRGADHRQQHRHRRPGRGTRGPWARPRRTIGRPGDRAGRGPALGGLILDTLGWHWTFWINVPVGLVGALIGWLVMPQRGDAWSVASTGGRVLIARAHRGRRRAEPGLRLGATSPALIGCVVLAIVFLTCSSAPSVERRRR